MKQLEQFFHKHIIKFTLIVTLPLWAAFAFAEDFDYVETNTWIKHSESGYSFGTRQHIDKDAQQYIHGRCRSQDSKPPSERKAQSRMRVAAMST